MTRITMNELRQRLEQEAQGDPVRGSIGQESEWLGFTQVELSDGLLLICDVAFLPSEEEGLSVVLPAGRYEVQAKVLEYPGDRRVSRLRVAPAGVQVCLGEQLGETWTDTGQISICDLKVVKRYLDAAKIDDDALSERIERARDEQGQCGVLELDPTQGAVAPFVDSGFGDGTFPVYALTADGQRVGVEIEFIAAGEPYPFNPVTRGGAPVKRDPNIEEMWADFGNMLARVRAQRTGDKEKDRALLQRSFAEFFGGVENRIKAVFNEFRQLIISVRKSPLPLAVHLIPAREAAWTQQPEAQERIQALRRAGFAPAGCFEVPELPTYQVSGWVQQTENVQALVERTKSTINLVLASRLADGREFCVADTPERPGITRPPWEWREHRPGLAPDALIATFFQRRPPPATLPLLPEEFPRLIEAEFRRVQAWRAERGGWTIAEIKLQRGLPATAETTEELLMARHRSAELWLFNWLRLQNGLPFDPEAVLERLVIIHDDLTPDLLANEWRVATNDYRAKDYMFVTGSPREAFARVNEERRSRLRCVLRKTTGFPADFYLPADTPG